MTVDNEDTFATDDYATGKTKPGPCSGCGRRGRWELTSDGNTWCLACGGAETCDYCGHLLSAHREPPERFFPVGPWHCGDCPWCD